MQKSPVKGFDDFDSDDDQPYELGQFSPHATHTLGDPPSGPTREELEWAREQGARDEDEVRDLIKGYGN